jgi:hypothetical protein
MMLPETAPYTFCRLVNYFFAPMPKQSAQMAKFCRLYNFHLLRHFYTSDPVEIRNAKRSGWQFEMVQGYIYKSPNPGTGLVPLHRLHSERGNDYLYAISNEAVNAAKTNGYRYDRIQGYVFPPRSPEGWPVYGVDLGTERLLTIDLSEYTMLKGAGTLGEQFRIVPF